MEATIILRGPKRITPEPPYQVPSFASLEREGGGGEGGGGGGKQRTRCNQRPRHAFNAVH
jgi:hypothetical protein